MITLEPVGGLCNRLRAIDSAISLCRKLNQKLTINWVKNHFIATPFSGLFEPLNLQDVTIFESERFAHWALDNNSFDLVINKEDTRDVQNKPDHFNHLANYRNVLMVSDARFYDNPGMYENFSVVPAVQSQIIAECVNFNKKTVGIHIRRTDSADSIRRSPLSAFIAAIEQELNQSDDANFYLASDDLGVKHDLVDRFGTCIITNYEKNSRADLAGMRRAVVELYSLSKTSKIFGSYWSSYSEMAADLSGIKRQTIIE